VRNFIFKDRIKEKIIKNKMQNDANKKNRINKKIFIIAGEASGDLHGSLLAKAIKNLDSSIKLFGMGGEKMRQADVEILFDSPALAVTGFIEVLKHFSKFKEAFNLLLKKLMDIRPDCMVLIDYPGFNLRLAKKIKNLNIKLIYYISPQLWAWDKSRVKIIRRFVDKMLVVFKFEEDFYRQFNIKADFVGHPLMDILTDYKNYKPAIVKSSAYEEDKKIALLPGSRENEVERILPIMLSACRIIQTKTKGAKFLLARNFTVKKETYLKITKKYNLNHLVWYEDKTYDCLKDCDFALVCSGTATLETAIFLKPMAIIYKMSLLSYLIIRALIKVPYIGLVNLISREKIVDEFVQFNARPRKIADYVLKVLRNADYRQEIEAKLIEVRKKLGPPGASERAAVIILENLPH